MMNQNIKQDTDSQVTLIVLVSSIDQTKADDARKFAQPIIDDQKIRLFLIGHGNSVTKELLAQVTGDASLVYEWTKSQPDNYQDWFKTVINCPTTSKSSAEEEDARFLV